MFYRDSIFHYMLWELTIHNEVFIRKEEEKKTGQL